ncbi:MAG: hypothetical protein OIN87_10205 [Candidatus Methanoperedens sp.]|nr:hypothetical protein [Candidatus Methanoperedens sp.]
MKCKNSKHNCFVRIITTTWEEIRACEQGMACNFNKRVVKA